MKRVVIVGSGGRLGAALGREYAKQFDIVGFNHAQLDLAAPEQLRATLGGLEFEALINTAAQTNVDGAERHKGEALGLTGEAPVVWAETARGKKPGSFTSARDKVSDAERAA